VELYYGIAGIGAVCHPINIRYQVNKPNTSSTIRRPSYFVDATLVPLLEKIARCWKQ
jgi:fatty-acyl-CoA synthase